MTDSFDDRPYIAIELLDGADFGSSVERRGRRGSLTAAHAVLDATQCLAAAARAGLIHRDIRARDLPIALWSWTGIAVDSPVSNRGVDMFSRRMGMSSARRSDRTGRLPTSPARRCIFHNPRRHRQIAPPRWPDPVGSIAPPIAPHPGLAACTTT